MAINYNYRKKPVTIQAFQLTEETRNSNANWPEWAHRAWQKERDEVGSLAPSVFGDENSALSIATFEGIMEVQLGDWIIHDIQGELYPCKPEIFEETYEKE